MNRQEITFKTVDGLLLSGHLYPTEGYGPGIIMTPGFNFTKEMFLVEIAECFQQAGFTTLTYDPRSIGQSEGTPRNEIDPCRNIEDYHDALTYMKSLSLVDSAKIAFWGFSFSGMVALNATALDKRAKAVIAMSPLTIFDFPEDKWRGVLERSMEDRESQVSGNPPFSLPMVTEMGENPAGFGSGIDKEGFKLVSGARALVPDFQVPTTLQSYYHIAAWQPLELIPRVLPTPAMIITPEEDLVSPAEKQKRLIYDRFGVEKYHLTVPGKGHMNILGGDDFVKVMDEQVNFLKKAMGFSL
ncbi:peptidase s15 [Fusarium austroafricanum]|uniref:Peptidase s15 n=1 Tax=Fusarium austroafricanum TaxID=2364996 RepID=A0A8H4KN39_9HYPO|nr:peptidase s15 [Fusarium austroafricanum]